MGTARRPAFLPAAALWQGMAPLAAPDTGLAPQEWCQPPLPGGARLPAAPAWGAAQVSACRALRRSAAGRQGGVPQCPPCRRRPCAPTWLRHPASPCCAGLAQLLGHASGAGPPVAPAGSAAAPPRAGGAEALPVGPPAAPAAAGTHLRHNVVGRKVVGRRSGASPVRRAAGKRAPADTNSSLILLPRDVRDAQRMAGLRWPVGRPTACVCEPLPTGAHCSREKWVSSPGQAWRELSEKLARDLPTPRWRPPCPTCLVVRSEAWTGSTPPKCTAGGLPRPSGVPRAQ